MPTDGLVFHPLCLVREQAADAAFGNVEYRQPAVYSGRQP